MGDLWDYRLRKMEIAWELAQRMIPDCPTEIGGWEESNFLKKADEILKKTSDIVNTVFHDEKPK